MHQDALVRKSSGFEHWVAGIAVGFVAVLVGVIAGKGGWLYLPIVAVLSLLWFWPVEIAMGSAVVLLPFEYVTLLGGGLERSAMSVAFAFAFSVLCAVGVIGRRLQRPSPATLWWGLFLLWACASILWAVEPRVSFERVPTAVSLFLFYLVASSFRITEKEFDRIVWLTILGGALAAFLSVYGFYTGAGFIESGRATLAVGEEAVNPNRFGVRLLLPLAFAMARFFSSRQRATRIFALFLLAITGLALLLTMSRGTVIAAVVVIVVFFFRLNSPRLKTLKPTVRRFLVVVILMAIALGAVIPATFFTRFHDAATDRGAGRLDIWSVGLVILQHYPVAGAGLGNFPIIYNQFAGYASHLYFKAVNNDAHNVYLAVAVEEGIVGLLLFLMAIWVQFKIVAKCRSQIQTTPVMLFSCEAAFCGMLAASIFGTILWDKTFWLTWVLLAFVVTLQKNQVSRANSPIRTGGLI